MGYVHDTSMSQFVSPFKYGKSAGTWTPTLSSNVASDDRTAADANFNLFIPILLPSNSAALKGAYLKTIEVMYYVGTSAMDDVATVELEKVVFANDGTPTGSAPTVTLDTANDTAAERKATGYHRMVVTLSTPVWVDNDDAYWLYIAVDGSSGGVWKNYGAIVNFTLRI